MFAFRRQYRPCQTLIGHDIFKHAKFSSKPNEAKELQISFQYLDKNIQLFHHSRKLQKFPYVNHLINHVRVFATQGNQPTNENNAKVITEKTLDDTPIQVPPHKNEKQTESFLSRERNFITAIRAMTEFLLSPKHLEDLRKTKRRSPYENEPPITVFWRKDVESRAISVWGSKEAIESERKKRQKTMKVPRERNFNLNFRNSLSWSEKEKEESRTSSRVVWAAVSVNGLNFVMKFGAWLYTGSHTMAAEAVHSLADVTNQLILAYGIHKSKQQPDEEHPYGFTHMQYLSPLLSGVGIFFVGSGASLWHGINGLIDPTQVTSIYHAILVLSGALISETITLTLAMRATLQGARQHNMSFKDYVLKRNHPSVNVVLFEDLAAVAGVGVAISCMGLTSLLDSHIPDAIGSCAISGILALVAWVIIKQNMSALLGKSIPQRDLDMINNDLESDPMVRAVHDVKGIELGPGWVRYKAEVDFDGRALTNKYLKKKDIDAMYEETKGFQSAEDYREFMLKYGEESFDLLGAEVDRIEKELKKKHPRIRYCDLEVL